MTRAEQQRIVVGIDGSENSLAALRWALHEGVAANASVEVVHCWTAPTLTDVVFTRDEQLKRASSCMLDNEIEAAVAEMPTSPTITRLSLPGNPASVLVDRSNGARMLVLGLRQTAAMRDIAYGAVETVCRRHASCPIVTVDRLHLVTWHHPANTRATA